ncbi:inner membrane protein YiaA [Cellulomonas fengjieae]|uniref:YiaA/YiaB family protein n=1 Tax=Cellulomonas fengjieae TaxID=2819978 RepID=A0ABS3SKL3_9CELL|nr:inner membrane protein YiaA [Cellulomonas fengjieae]MBO3086288.1 YiaA/YiaB family protein [Cellulomonas fengjieae]MBO3102309.1 YiaA/YiaB family protein [Cellulomonas fengjieae]QVI65671.1 YiaA/YiaB family protein [Cellulomonas fengjieae]
MSQHPVPARPTAAFIGASWVALVIAISAFAIGLWNAEMLLSEKGFYGTLLLLGLFSAIALQKSVRDRAEGIPVTGIFLGLSWSMVLVSILLVSVGLTNATVELSEKGFFALAFTMALFSVVAVQKNVRDLAAAGPAPVAPSVPAEPDPHATVWQ